MMRHLIMQRSEVSLQAMFREFTVVKTVSQTSFNSEKPKSSLPDTKLVGTDFSQCISHL